MAEPIYLHRTIHETLAETRRLAPKALNKIVSRNLGSIMSGAQNTRERHPSGPRAAPSVENTLLESRNGKLSVRDLPRYPAMFVDDFTCPFYVYSNAELDQMMPRRKMGRVRPPRRDPDFWHCCSCAVRPCVPLHRWECLIPGCGDVYPLCRHKVCLEHMGEHPWCNDCCVVWSGIEAGYMHKRAGDWLDHLQQERVEGWARRDDWVANNPEKAQWRKYYMVVLELKGQRESDLESLITASEMNSKEYDEEMPSGENASQVGAPSNTEACTQPGQDSGSAPMDTGSS